MLKIRKLALIFPMAILVLGGFIYYDLRLTQELASSQKTSRQLELLNTQTNTEILTLKQRIDDLEKEDQRKTNKQLQDTINQMKDVYQKSVTVYEDLVDLRIISKNTAKLDDAYAHLVSLLSTTDYASASASLAQLAKDITAEKQLAVAASVPAPTNVPASNNPPASGYNRQTVTTDVGNFVVSLVSADLSSTKVIVDTASDSDCGNNCPVLPLAAYVSRSGAFAGVNGSYFCPAAYPTCAGKTNSYDLLVMNKNKHYFNSDNNVYSSNPAVIFGGSYIRFVNAASQWGRDTGVDGVLSNYPLLVQNGNITYGGDSDPKHASAGNRGFVANKGNTVYIGVVHSATITQSAHTLKALGLENALNLDDGGSTALYSGGYKVGPGRDLPNVILFIKK